MAATNTPTSPPVVTPDADAPAAPPPVTDAMDAFADRLDAPLYVVTVGTGTGNGTEEGGARSGCLAGFVTQCSITPPRFLVCLSKLNHTFFVGERSPGIAIHLLGEDQTGLASLFAESTGDTVDKFEHCSWSEGSSGAPVLDECAAWLEGSVLDRFSVGDHEAFLMSPTGGGPGRHHGLLMLKNSPPFRPAHPG